jgi:hypothetical protein
MYPPPHMSDALQARMAQSLRSVSRFFFGRFFFKCGEETADAISPGVIVEVDVERERREDRGAGGERR